MSSHTEDRLLRLKALEPAEGSTEAATLNRCFRECSIKHTTQESYATPLRWYLLVASFPPTGEKLETFIRMLTMTGCLKASTIRSYVSAVRTSAITAGHDLLSAPDAVRVSRALAAADRLTPVRSPPKRAGLIPLIALKKLYYLPTTYGTTNDMVKAICLLAFSLTLRLGEVLTLRHSNITILTTRRTYVRVRLTLNGTKTRMVDFRETACAGNQCGPWCTAHYLQRRKLSNNTDPPLFPSWKSSTVVSSMINLLQRE